MYLLSILLFVTKMECGGKEIKWGLGDLPPALCQIAGQQYENCSWLGFGVSFCRDTTMTMEKVSWIGRHTHGRQQTSRASERSWSQNWIAKAAPLSTLLPLDPIVRFWDNLSCSWKNSWSVICITSLPTPMGIFQMWLSLFAEAVCDMIHQNIILRLKGRFRVEFPAVAIQGLWITSAPLSVLILLGYLMKVDVVVQFFLGDFSTTLGPRVHREEMGNVYGASAGVACAIRTWDYGEDALPKDLSLVLEMIGAGSCDFFQYGLYSSVWSML